MNPQTGKAWGAATRRHGSRYLRLELPVAPALDRTTVSALRARRSLQRSEREQAGECHRDSGYVFTSPGRDPRGPDRLSRIFRALIAEHGLPPIRLHDLRHGAPCSPWRPEWS